jgi:hypothetical protein
MVLAVLVAVVGTIAVYCWMNPEARKSGISSVERVWNSVKSGGDKLILQAKDVTSPQIPEPELKIKID